LKDDALVILIERGHPTWGV